VQNVSQKISFSIAWVLNEVFKKQQSILSLLTTFLTKINQNSVKKGFLHPSIDEMKRNA